MSMDVFTTHEHRSFWNRMAGSFGGLILGPLLLVASFFILFWNEGRVDVSQLAANATDITTLKDTTPYHDTLVSYTGTVTSSEQLGDDYLQGGSYLTITRMVEMYAWRETTKRDSTKNLGGSEDITTTYTYTKEWTTSPEDSARFALSEGHINPILDVQGRSNFVSTAHIGPYALDMSRLELSGTEAIRITEQNALPADGFVRQGSYLYRGTGTTEQPEVGDIRISYKVLPNPLPDATVFGVLTTNGNAIRSYYDGNASLYYLTRASREDGIKDMHQRYMVTTWLFRFMGFALMFFGMMMFFTPLTTLLDVIPFLGNLTRGLLGGVSFVLSLILTTTTILVSMIFHNAVAVIVVCVIVTILTLYVINKVRRKASNVTN